MSLVPKISCNLLLRKITVYQFTTRWCYNRQKLCMQQPCRRWSRVVIFCWNDCLTYVNVELAWPPDHRLTQKFHLNLYSLGTILYIRVECLCYKLANLGIHTTLRSLAPWFGRLQLFCRRVILIIFSLNRFRQLARKSSGTLRELFWISSTSTLLALHISSTCLLWK